jgi:hypothetical protein
MALAADFTQMSKHHHHPHEGHGSGAAPGSGRKPLHHNVFFWVAGFFILIALLAFIFSGNLALQPALSTPQPTPSAGVAK